MTPWIRIEKAEDVVARGLNGFAFKIQEAAAALGHNRWDLIADGLSRHGIDVFNPDTSPLYALTERLVSDHADLILVNEDKRSGEYTIHLAAISRTRFTMRAEVDILVPADLALFEAAWELNAIADLLSHEVAVELGVAR